MEEEGCDKNEGLTYHQEYNAINLDQNYIEEEHPNSDISEESEYSDEDSLDYDDPVSANSDEESE